MPARELKEVRNTINLPGCPWLWAEQTSPAAGDLGGFKRGPKRLMRSSLEERTQFWVARSFGLG